MTPHRLNGKLSCVTNIEICPVYGSLEQLEDGRDCSGAYTNIRKPGNEKFPEHGEKWWIIRFNGMIGSAPRVLMSST